MPTSNDPKPRKPRAKKPDITDPAGPADTVDPKMEAVYSVIERAIEKVLDRRAEEDFRRQQDEDLDRRINGNVLDADPFRIDNRRVPGLSMVRLIDEDQVLSRLRTTPGVFRVGKIAGVSDIRDDDLSAHDGSPGDESPEHDPETCPDCVEALAEARAADLRAYSLEFLPHIPNIVGPFVKLLEDKDGLDAWKFTGAHESIEGELGEFLRATLRAGTAVADAVAKGVK